jgi:hypothetical protein
MEKMLQYVGGVMIKAIEAIGQKPLFLCQEDEHHG